MRRFLLGVIFSLLTCGAYAAGYTCDSIKQYTSCSSGYYMTYNGSYDGTPKAGNKCTACTSGCTCAGGTANKVCCTNTCTSTNNTSSTQSCTYTKSISNGTQNWSGSQTCNGKYTGGNNCTGSCTGCSSWGTCSGGTLSSVKCNAGYYKNTSNTCSLCEAGYYCPGGTYTQSTSIAGRSTCSNTKHANAEYYGTGGSSSTCPIRCKANYYGNGSTCTACNVSFTDTGSCSRSANISNGQQNFTGGSQSRTCYHTTSAAGSTASSSCTGTANCGSYGTCSGGTLSSVKCNAGYYKNTSNTCSLCEAGYYCPGGTYTQSTSIAGRSTCSNTKHANAEYYGTGGSSSTCPIRCKANYYGNGSTCTACNVSFTTSQSCSYTSNITGGVLSYSNGTQSRTCYHTTSAAGSTAASSCTGTANCGSYGTCSGGTRSSVKCNAGYYWDGSACAKCGGNQYYCPGFSDVASPTNGYGRNSVSSGYYSTGGDANTRTGQSKCGGNAYYCSGGVRNSVSSGYYSTGGTSGDEANTRTGQSQCTGATYCSGGVQNNCPDATAKKRTTFPANYYNPVLSRTGVQSANGRTAITQCQALSWYNPGGRVGLYEYVNYNSTTDKYDTTSSWAYMSVKAGYYLTNKSGCGSYAYYTEVKECPAGSYCPGKNQVECGSSNQATVHTTNFGLETCGAGTYSGAGASSCTGCADGTYQPSSGQSSCLACSSLSGVSPTGGTYSSVSPRNANTTCRYKAPNKTITGCATVTTNTMAYSGTAWPATTYSVTSSAGYHTSNSGTASATCTGCADGTYSTGNTATCSACSALTAPAVTGGTYSSVSPRNANTTCRYKAPTPTKPTHCASKTSNTISYTGTAWNTNIYSVSANAGAIISGNNTKDATCTQCSGAVWSAGGTATSCSACPAQTDGWTRNTGTGWSEVTSCNQTKAVGGNCTEGTLRQNATSTTAWGSSVVHSALKAKAGSYVNGQTCTQCSAGYYQGTNGSTTTSCTAASKGYNVPSAGSSSQTACGSGKYQDATGQSSCKSCPTLTSGYAYTSTTGLDAVTKCVETKSAANVSGNCYGGQLTKTATSTTAWGTATSTLTAKAGSHLSGNGDSTTCTQCTGATFQTTNGSTATSCTACVAAESTWTAGTGTGWTAATSCYETKNATAVSSYCSAGQLKKNATSENKWPTAATISVAFQAKPGSFVNGQTCEQCAAGSYTNAAGTQTSCTKCATGTYNTAKGQTSCSTCVSGTTNTGTGNTACGASCTAIDGLATWSGSALCTVDKCAAGRYKNGNTCPTCGSATNSLYTQSAQGTTSANSCYLTTDAGKYVATAKAGQVDCPANSYCVGGVVIYYGTGTTTGGSATCASGTSSKYTKSAAKSSKVGHCYLTLTAGKQVASAGAGISDCSAGRYCTSTGNIYFNTDGGTAAYTGSACSALGGGLYTNSAVGADANTDCYIAAAAISGKYLTANTATTLTTCEAGYKCPATAVYWPNVGNRTACTDATYSDTTGATACTTCPTTSGATSYGTTDNTKRAGCWAWFGAKTMSDGSMNRYWCYVDPSANTYGASGNSKCGVYKTDLKCVGGYYSSVISASSDRYEAILTATALAENACSAVGAGYWSAADSLTRTQCATGLTTIGYGAGADEAADCGRILHAGDRQVYLRSEKKTTPSLNVKIGDTTYYGNMTSGALDGYLIIKDGNITYRVHDDSKQ